MLRVLTSTLRFPRPWKPLETRGCSSNPGAAGREIQVCALAGPNQGIAEILMNRPSARNALGNVFVSQLLEALAQLREDRQVRVLIFRSGVKGVFCAGQAPRTSFLRREMLHPRPTTRSKRMRVELRTDSAVALEGTPGRREEAAEGEGGKRVILRQFQGHVAQSPGLNCQDPHEQPGAGGGKGSMRTSLPDPTALIEALLLLRPLPLAPPWSEVFHHGHFMTVSPAPHPSSEGQEKKGACRRSESAPDLLWNPGLVPVSLCASVSPSVTEGLGLIRLPKALPTDFPII